MKLSRRNLLAGAAGAGGLALSTGPIAQGQTPQAAAQPDFRVTKGRIRQSVMGWCFKPMPIADLARHSREIGLVAIEGISPEEYPAAKSAGLAISLVGSHGFARGPFSPANREFCVSKLREGIELAVEVGCPSVITFTGMREPGISDEQGAANCVAVWKEVIGLAEQKKINLCLEHLNTRDTSHPMKGHPGYFGDNVDFASS